ncbi:MAG: ribonuclease III domain-containing protein, partial [Chloroflexota bacterium]
MTHRSYIHEVDDEVADNERLEFLGDAVLNFLSGDMLYKRFPDRAEGWLTRLRAALVRTESLRELAVECELGDASWPVPAEPHSRTPPINFAGVRQ